MSQDERLEQVVFEGRDAQHADQVRGELISWNAADYWFYVYRDGTIAAANSFGGKLSAEKVKLVKEKAKEISWQLESKVST